MQNYWRSIQHQLKDEDELVSKEFWISKDILSNLFYARNALYDLLYIHFPVEDAFLFI